MLAVLEVTQRTSLSRIREICASASSPLPIRLSPNLRPSRLVLIIANLQMEPFGGELVELICSHRNATSRVLHRAVLAFGEEAGVQNAVATNVRAPRGLLEKLARSKTDSVRGHARLNLFRRKLRTAKRDEVERAIFKGIPGVDDFAIRYVVACHPRTRVATLRLLHELGPDVVRRAVAARLGKV